MEKLKLITFPSNILRIITRPVQKFNDELQDTSHSMADVMYATEGIGLAATQVGLDISILVIDTGGALQTFINPTIIKSSAKKVPMEEGCLSLPGVTVTVSRPEHITVRAFNLKGEAFTKEFDGLMAKVVQHELDHLHGKLLIDYLNPLRKILASKRLASNKRKLQIYEN